MKCRYRFPIKGTLRIAEDLPIVVGDITFRLSCDSIGQIVAVDAEVTVPDSSEWPYIEDKPSPGVAIGLKGTAPRFDDIQRSLRIVEGLLSMLGIESIDTRALSQEWIPETADERSRLNVFGLRRRLERPPPEAYPPVPFQYVALSFLAIPRAGPSYPAMSFYRKGRTDFHALRYIEAIYDFYFMIETLYAGGKSRTVDVKERFSRSPDLRTAIQAVIGDPRTWVSLEPEPAASAKRFGDRYGGKDVDSIVDELVTVRGFLHHHAQKRPDIWDPDDHQRYELEAMLLAAIAEQIATGLTKEPLFGAATRDEYRRQFGKPRQPAA